MGVTKDAMADAVLTSLWVFFMPVTRISTSVFLTSYLGIQGNSLSGLFANTLFTSLLLIIFNLISRALGGASFNPATSAAFFVAGRSPGASLLSTAVRFPAQAAGGVAGVKAILTLVPHRFRDKLRGPSLKVDVHTGAFAEGALTFLFCFSVLFVVFRGPKSPLLKVWLLSIVTAGLVFVGSGYTGPSMNPANAFGWAYANDRHNSWEQFYVYWICSVVGAVLAAGFFRVLFSKPVVVKEKKA